MKTLLNVGRYHLVDRVSYLGVPWAVVAFTFLINVVIFTMVATDDNARTGALITVYIMMFVTGLMSVTKSLPFAFALGVTRRTYYLGSMLTIVAVAVTYGLVLTILNVLEGATGGWALSLHFFRVAWILDGPWYLTWLTSFVGLVLLYLYGMWFGLMHRRWNVLGLITFSAAQVIVLLGAALVVTWLGSWPAVGDFFSTLTAAGVTGVLAVLAALLAAGGFATMRRVTV